MGVRWMKPGCGHVEGGCGRGAVQGSRDPGYREVIMFLPLYLRMWNNTVMILFSRTELCASKQYYFLMSVLSLFVCSARIMFSGWGEGPSATRVFTCFHLNPLSTVNTTGIGGLAAEPEDKTAPINLFLGKLFTGSGPGKMYSFLVQLVPRRCYPGD